MNVDLPIVDIKRILYATDLSENARYAMAYAVSLANTYCAQITILHVIDETPEFRRSACGRVHRGRPVGRHQETQHGRGPGGFDW